MFAANEFVVIDLKVQSMETNPLRANCLSFSELLGQAVALISPTMTAALIIPVMFSNTGNMSWLAYALGTVMLLFVAFNLNQFARRSAGVGSMYAYTCRGLGLTAGGVAGWSLVWAYLGIAMAGMTGFAVFAGKLTQMAGHSVSPLVFFVVCAVTAWYCAWRNVQLSAVLMLILEGASMLLILGLCFIVLQSRHFAIDTKQLGLSDTPLSSMGLGVVVAIFSLVGFECATAFGTEAKDPLKSIPRAVIWSLIVSGVFFVFVTYVMVDGFTGYAITLDKIDAPLNILAELAHVKFLQVPLSLGAMFTFFSLTLSCINAGARVIFAMGRHGLFHEATADAHSTNETPHVAVSLMAIIAFLVPAILFAAHNAPLDIFNWVGTLAAFGFLVPYFLITIAAPVYLSRLGQLRRRDVGYCVAALLLLMIPAIGSVYPLPPAPVVYFPYIFFAYLAAGAGWIVSLHRREPAARTRIREELASTHEQYQLAATQAVNEV
ncbi:amino acid/polyamine/organocation transporter, APC superfamily [Paraburkholderia phenazinium]|uniref:Amino acid/polyamine/organocation transporter, APC superfamily n=2 Tax=Paraburkholderia phenazinium TaxID=60549 RepID=A0A1N6KCB4_9BURK|nr:amino acid/polyamine/organocation transporter, APC superfamily [Paraburkholderia phenazinium]